MQLAILVAVVLLTVVSPHDPTARVHDFANLLSAEERASLEDLARAVERQTTDRKFMDDTAGAINRREVAEKPFDEELAAYQAYFTSWRARSPAGFRWRLEPTSNRLVEHLGVALPYDSEDHADGAHIECICSPATWPRRGLGV